MYRRRVAAIGTQASPPYSILAPSNASAAKASARDSPSRQRGGVNSLHPPPRARADQLPNQRVEAFVPAGQPGQVRRPAPVGDGKQPRVLPGSAEDVHARPVLGSRARIRLATVISTRILVSGGRAAGARAGRYPAAAGSARQAGCQGRPAVPGPASTPPTSGPPRRGSNHSASAVTVSGCCSATCSCCRNGRWSCGISWSGRCSSRRA